MNAILINRNKKEVVETIKQMFSLIELYGIVIQKRVP